MQEPIAANPYAAPAARIEPQYTSGDTLQLASRGARLGAYVLDAVIGLVLMVPMYGMLFATIGNPDGSHRALGTMMVASFVALAALAVYNLVLLHRDGQTLGKKWVGIRIVRTDGSRAGLGRILALRYIVPGLIGAIPVVGFLFFIADPLFIFAEDRRTLHDKIADTIVVDA